MTSRLSQLGLLLILLGAGIMIPQTMGFATMSADRGVSVDVADSSEALLAVEQLDTTVTDQNEHEEILKLTNNAGEPLQLDVTVILGSGLENPDGFDDSLPAGGETTYAVTCEPGSGGGTTSVEVTVHSAVGDSVTVSDISETYGISRDCPGPGGPGGRPPADDVYDVRQEQWHGDREYVFEITHNNVWEADWQFGDGTTASGHYVTHTYAEDGTYEVTLTAVVDGEEYTYTETLEVGS